ncbi:hypothetical protein AAG570_010054 [Ranatra chinensis]|uniref:Glucose-methanol-choline oxidoreductase N-terminal domain-containing protein n=1 Tax=Ranatra chinensis TaxID=642074 RepID=A0ABD0YLT6_9HEMI
MTLKQLLINLLMVIMEENYDMVDPLLRPAIIDVHQLLPEYDFIVVGAGSAGSVVASRLSEVASWSVLLIEAGPDEDFQSETPRLAFSLWNSWADWNYTSVPQKNACRGTSAGRCYWPRGRLLGGSSASNTMFYTRGNRRDYDGWEAAGNPGWGFKRVLPYFLKSQDQTSPKYLYRPGGYHTTGGYLTTSDSPWAPELAQDFMRAAKLLGHEETDLNGAKQSGFSLFHGTMRNGSRCSTAKAFLRPARLRENLHVLTEAEASRVLTFDRTANGVEFVHSELRFKVKARKEVILSAGTINSPQILLKSGVGPKTHLAEMGIPLVHNLPVGENLHDHVGVLLEFRSDSPVSNSFGVFSTDEAVSDYVKRGVGPLTGGGIDAMGLFSSSKVHSTLDYPDIGVLLLGGPLDDERSPEIWNLFPVLVRPKSRGRVTLGADGAPLMDPQYLTAGGDAEALKEAVRFAFDLADTAAMKRRGATFNSAVYSNCAHLKFRTGPHIDCLVANYSITFFHPVGTCRMGPPYNPASVVDSQFRVHGVSRLRVVDGSAMPEVVNTPTNAPIIMMAERAADLIKDYWRDYQNN